MSVQTSQPDSRPQTSPLRSIREAQGLSLAAVAERARVDRGHLSRAERGRQTLSINALYRVAQALNMTVLSRQLEPYVRERES